MNYRDIIHNNCNQSKVSWWPKYAYHFTDVRNAVNILRTGTLYSRIEADERKLMVNDNASKQVIDMTHAAALSNVRFYFRPLTPTQYYNEGYKHRLLRYDEDSAANIPVPVFFFMDLEKLLNDPCTRFSEKAQSGYGNQLCSTPDEFARFQFDKIYDSGFISGDDVQFRHAEILYPDSYPIKNALRFIVCRNEVEKATLLNSLYEKDKKQYFVYKDRVVVNSKDLFENNGLFVTSCDYRSSTIGIQFSNTRAKQDYIERRKKANNIKGHLPDVKADIDFTFKKADSTVRKARCFLLIDYENPKTVSIKNLSIEGADMLEVKIYFGTSLMCFMKYDISMRRII